MRMSQYKKLVSDTFIFALGTFSSKALVFLMIPIYTRVLSSGEYGVVDLIVNTCNLLIPIVSGGMAGAVTRFGLERQSNKSAVFSAGVLINLVGIALLLFSWPLISKINVVGEYSQYVFIYVAVSCLRAICGQFTRALGRIKLYAFDGLIRTIMTIGFNILLMVIFEYGIVGYLVANIVSDLISAVYLVVAARLYKYFDITKVSQALTKNMLIYAIPLIPTTIAVWLINIANRYIITYFLGAEANGLYAVAYKIPTLIIIVSAIFMDAWQISALQSQSRLAKERFFSNVIGVYQSIVFLVAATIIFLAKWLMALLASPEYFVAWQYIPVLVIATGFMCLSNFLGSIYMVEKKSGYTLVTTVACAGVSIGLNYLLIPEIGIQGAAVSMLISYGALFAIRAIHTRKFMLIRWNLPKLMANTLIISIQSVIMLIERENGQMYVGLLLIAAILVNIKDIVYGAKKVF